MRKIKINKKQRNKNEKTKNQKILNHPPNLKPRIRIETRLYKKTNLILILTLLKK
jgi:hypothetical protein